MSHWRSWLPRHIAFVRREVDTHGDEFNHLFEAFTALAQKMRRSFTNQGIERRDYANDTDFARALGFRNVHQKQVVLRYFHVVNRIAEFHSATGARQRHPLCEPLLIPLGRAINPGD